MLKRLLFTFIVSLIAFSAYGFASEEDQLEQATQAYDQGDFDSALQHYRSLVEQYPNNGYLYYNMANVFYRKGQVGEAMAALLKARSLRPRDPDLKANINFLKDQISDQLNVEKKSAMMQAFGFWTAFTTPKEVSYAAGVLLMLLFLSASAWLWKPQISALKPMTLVLAAASLAMVFAASISFSQRQMWGAVVDDQVSVHSGPASTHTKLFDLKRGAPFLVSDQAQAGWFKIELSDGKKGWLAADKVRVYQ